jgi:hypothetical protein
MESKETWEQYMYHVDHQGDEKLSFFRIKANKYRETGVQILVYKF